MSAALHLADAGQKVVLCEALKYPGGCASTFKKNGYRFETGATLFSGFDEQQLFSKWIRKYGLDVQIDNIDPVIRFRSADFTVDISRCRETTANALCQIPNAPQQAIRRFFAYQEKIADVLWPVFDCPSRLPPFSWSSLWWHCKRALKYPKLLPLINRSLFDVLKKYDLDKWPPFVQYVNAISQITIQVDLYRAEALFGLVTLDYPFRGSVHIHEGIDAFNQQILGAIERCGGQVQLASRVKGIRKIEKRWEVETRQGVIQCKNVVANLLPQNISKLLREVEVPNTLFKKQKEVEKGWGAGMVYLVIDDHSSLPRHAFHVQGIDDAELPFQEGNHVFASVSAADENTKAPIGQRTVTVSTHIPIQKLQSLTPQDQGQYVSVVQEKIKQTLHKRMPEIMQNVVSSFSASPRTWERFTGRKMGYVGGVPRTKGLHNYAGVFPTKLLDNFWMVGDSVFPGQSTLAAAVGGVRTANAVMGVSVPT